MGKTYRYSVAQKHQDKNGIRKAALIALVIAAVFVVVVLLLWFTRQSLTPEVVVPALSRSQKYGNAAVVVDAVNCSQVGIGVLRRNGSAVDAAIATSLCAGLMNRAGSGIGGGFFMLYYDRTSKQVYAIDARETAPLAANSTMFSDKPRNATMTGSLSVAVPSAVAGYREAHKRFGRIPWSQLFDHAIDLCDNGANLSRWTSIVLNNLRSQVDQFPELKELFTVNGQYGKEGMLIKDSLMARTFRRIANDSNTFYSGKLAEEIVADLRDAGTEVKPSLITLEDLSKYTVKWREPLRMPWIVNGRQLTVLFFPPPSAGVVLGLVINVLTNYLQDCRDSSCRNMSDPLVMHRAVEAFKFAFARRAKLADPDFVDSQQLLQRLLSADYANEVRKRINDSGTLTNLTQYFESLSQLPADGGTSQLSLIDANGNAVSMTSTINYGFGSMIRGLRTGIIFNDEMGDFSLPNFDSFTGMPPNEANFIQPQKRPLSSMSPIIILDENGDVIYVTGGVGGLMILSTVLQPILRELLYNETLTAAVDAPRFHNQLTPDTLSVQPSFSKPLRAELQRRGHKVQELPWLDYAGVVQTLRVYRDPKSGTNKEIVAISDYRRASNFSGY